MKKLMTVLLGLAFLVGTGTISFAQDQKTDTATTKKKKSKKKKSDTKTSQQR